MKKDNTEFATQITLAAIEKGLPEARNLDDICKFYKAIYECMSECNEVEASSKQSGAMMF